MHWSVRDKLEALLTPERWPKESQEIRDHLSSCESCLAELNSMKEQAAALRSLRAPENVEPAPGFYARVLQRIEERAKDSIWGVFLYSQFARRLVYASLTLTLVLGAYVISEEALDGHLGGRSVTARRIAVVGDQAQQRDAVLANFITSE